MTASENAPSAAKPSTAEHNAMRFGLDYLLRMIHEISRAFDGDLLSGLIFLAVVRANGQHLGEPAQLNFANHVGVIPDPVRRPVSTKSVADSLNLPYETVRRRLGGLCASGWCLKQPGGGYLVREEVLLRSDSMAVLSRNLTYFQMLLTRAQRAGLSVAVD